MYDSSESFAERLQCLNESRKKHRAEFAGESMYVHSEQRRNLPQSAVFTVLPLRPRPYEDAGLSSRGSELLGLQVQGLCCPLQQRPSSGRMTHGVTPHSRGGGDGSLTLLSSLKGRLESRGKPASRSSTGSRPETISEGADSAVCRNRDPVRETAETPTTPCDKKRQAHHGHLGDANVSQLHLYLPSSLCDEEEQEAEDFNRGD
ncbi:uncharacterized protein [Cebidichthys violaceus]|uniref:uncharacterized protein n=1 Tax=Cebidichthys violaceus TaxID=271503 RepID=UPI0035CC93A9